MAIAITWHPPRPSGVRICEFQHGDEPVRMSAAVCVQREWKGEPESVSWIVDRDAWAQAQAQIITDRMDYAASPEGLKAAAQEEYNREQVEIDRATARQAELKSEHPDLTDSVEA